MKGSSKKGSTLLELCIVMALISILLAIIGSFAVSVNGFTAAAKKKNDVTQDYLLCKKYIESWVSRFKEEGYKLSVVQSGEGEESRTNCIKATKNNGGVTAEYAVSASVDVDGKFTLTLEYEPVGDESKREVKYVSEVLTSVKFSNDGDNRFIKCEIGCEDDVMAFVIGGVL